MNQNRNPVRRGFSRNGAPAGYGQQRGASPFLDSPDPSQGQDERGARAPMAYERNAPAAPEQEAMPAFLGPQGNEDPTQNGPGGQPPPFQQALQQRSKQFGPELASAQGFQPQQSTGSGAFGAGARLPQGYGQGQQPNPAYNQQQPQGGPLDQYGQSAAAQRAYAAPPQDQFTAGVRNQLTGQPGAGFGQQQPQQQQDPNAPPQGGGGLADAVARARQNNFSDIEGAQNIAAGNFQGQLEGFGNIDPGGERGSNTHKKLFGRIASRYDVSQPGAVRTMMQDPDFQAAFPGAKLVEHPNADLIDFGDGNPVDVIRGAVAGGSGAGWQWGVGGGQGAPQQMGGAMGPAGPQAPGGAAADMSSQLLAALQGGQGASGTSIEQLFAALGLDPSQFQQQNQF